MCMYYMIRTRNTKSDPKGTKWTTDHFEDIRMATEKRSLVDKEEMHLSASLNNS